MSINEIALNSVKTCKTLNISDIWQLIPKYRVMLLDGLTGSEVNFYAGSDWANIPEPVKHRVFNNANAVHGFLTVFLRVGKAFD